MCEFGCIVLVPLPFTDLTSAKVRPALVVSKSGRRSRDVVVCFITSQQTDQHTTSVLRLAPTAKSGLKVPSMVRFDKIATLDRRIVLGELGRVDPRVLRTHRRTFFSVFGF